MTELTQEELDRTSLLRNIAEQAWGEFADASNQWDDLDFDEKIALILREAAK